LHATDEQRFKTSKRHEERQSRHTRERERERGEEGGEERKGRGRGRGRGDELRILRLCIETRVRAGREMTNRRLRAALRRQALGEGRQRKTGK
jgi:hypothetical protein